MCAARPRTISIYLPDGDVLGIKRASFGSQSPINVTYVPRAQLEKAKEREELSGVSLYFLVDNENGDETTTQVYIGETESGLTRLGTHSKLKEFWQYALIVTSATGHFTKTEVKYLEWLAYKNAKEAGRCTINNSSIPSRPHVTDIQSADLEENFERIDILVSTLGLPLFRPLRQTSTNKKEMIFSLKSRGSDAKGIFTEEGFIVISGSVFAPEMTERMKDPSKFTGAKNRLRMINDGLLRIENGKLILTKDTLFKTPSGASETVSGISTNGWVVWLLPDGRTLSDVYRT